MKSDENITDVFAKNLRMDIYVKHENEFMGRHDNSNL
jgi:hypothetical protein